jgi:3-hydroxyacyl-[acyl-carrier-protein] dehydratase
MGSEWFVAIGVDHPSLAGHFPDYPVVPGVVVLGEIMNAFRKITKEKNMQFVGVPSVKFISPLTPGEFLRINIEQQGNDAIEFTCTTETRLIANGCLLYRILAEDTMGAA